MLSEGVATARGRARVHLHRDRVNGELRGAQGRAAHRAHQRRRHPGHLQLPGHRRARGARWWARSTRTSPWRAWPGDVFVLGTTTWRIQRVHRGARCGWRTRSGSAAHRAVLARRGARRAPTSCRSRWAGCARSCCAATDAQRLARAASWGCAARGATRCSRYLRAGRAGAGRRAQPARRWSPSASSTRRAACSSSSTRRSAGASTAPGAWRCASASAAPSTSSCRRRRPTTASCSRWASSTASRSADIFDFLSPRRVEEVLTQAVLQAPMFGTRFRWNAAARAGAVALAVGQEGAAADPARALGRPARRGLPRAGRLPGQPRRRRHRAARPPAGRRDDGRLPARGDGRRRAEARCSSAMKARHDPRWRAVDLPEPSVVRARDAQLQRRTPTSTTRRWRSGGRARCRVRRTLPAEDAAALRRAGRRGDRPGGRGRAAAGARRGRAARRAAAARCSRRAEVLPASSLAAAAGASARAARRVELALRERRGARRGPLVAARARAARAGALPGRAAAPLAAAAGRPARGRARRRRSAVVRGRDGGARAHHRRRELAARGVLLPRDRGRAGAAPLESEGRCCAAASAPDAASGRSPSGATAGCSSASTGSRWAGCARRSSRSRRRTSCASSSAGTTSTPSRAARPRRPAQGGRAARRATRRPPRRGSCVLFPARMQQYLAGAAGAGVLQRRGRLGPAHPARRRSRRSARAAAHRCSPSRRRAAASRRRAARNAIAHLRAPRGPRLAARRRAPERAARRRSAPLPEDLSHAARDVAEALERRGACFFHELVLAAAAAARRGGGRAVGAARARRWSPPTRWRTCACCSRPKLRKRQRATAARRPGPLEPAARPPSASSPRSSKSSSRGCSSSATASCCATWWCASRSRPPWRELLYVYRRMEARGEVRGGRFLAGFAGEQFALPEAVDVARATRRREKTGEVIRISAVDPLNLTGIVTPGDRVASVDGPVRHVRRRRARAQNTCSSNRISSQ